MYGDIADLGRRDGGRDETVALSAEDGRRLLEIARRALREHLSTGSRLTVTGEGPALMQSRAAFVTLRRRDTGELRGCRGELRGVRPLVESVIAMAKSAATDDPRMAPVTFDEIAEIDITINVLGALHELEPEDVVIGRHGLLVVKGSIAGTLLPEVPVSFGWTREQFLREVCMKADLPGDAWRRRDVSLYGFETHILRDRISR